MPGLSEEDYKYFCQLLSESNRFMNFNDLQSLKEKYRDEINSERRLECIDSVPELIKVLEKRGCLSKENISELYVIARTLNQHNLIRQFTQRINGVDFNQKTNSSYHNQGIKLYLQNPLSNIFHFSGSVNDLVRTELQEKLGKSWLEFARALDIQECKIDDLKIKYPDQCELCIKKILEIHDDKYHGKEWTRKLLKALYKARRNDLRNSIEKILVRST